MFEQYQATVVVKSIINDDDEMIQRFPLSTGNNTVLILISVFASLGGVLLLSFLFSIIFLRRRKRYQNNPQRQSQAVVDNTAEDNEVWFNVNLNSPRSGNNSFFNSSFEVQFIPYLRFRKTYSFILQNDNNIFTTIENENYNDLPISRYISQISSTQSRRDSDQEFSDSDISEISCLGKAVIAIGGGADLGAGQISVRDHEVEN